VGLKLKPQWVFATAVAHGGNPQDRAASPLRETKIHTLNQQRHISFRIAISIPCPFFVGRVKRQRNPTLMLGYGYGFYVATQAIATLWLTPRSANVNVPHPNLQIKTFFDLDKVLLYLSNIITT
jgi:hypothetical protein